MNWNTKTLKEPIKVEDIGKVYSGRPGCCCGCRGKYWDDLRNIKRIVKTINANPISTANYLDDKLSHYFLDGSRWYTAYPKENG